MFVFYMGKKLKMFVPWGTLVPTYKAICDILPDEILADKLKRKNTVFNTHTS